MMRTDTCQCGQTLFFDNTQCVSCHTRVGWCDACRRVAALEPLEGGRFRCHHESCRAELDLCHNYQSANVCNWTIPAPGNSSYCAACELTEVIPALAQPEHHQRWHQLEAAKRRLLYSLDLLGLPYRRNDPAAFPPLRFQFLDPGASETPVATGHSEGLITISLVEADDVEREKNRVAFAEPQRTLIGHFRHEIGHYYWDVLVAGIDETSFRDVFGDERSPAYEDAKNTYYEQGPRLEWPDAFISAYASMHPWEDFAETFSGYLEVISLFDTAQSHGLIDEIPGAFSAMIAEYRRWAIILNELSRERGLRDLVPEILTPPVVEKLNYVHRLMPNQSLAKKQPSLSIDVSQ